MSSCSWRRSPPGVAWPEAGTKRSDACVLADVVTGEFRRGEGGGRRHRGPPAVFGTVVVIATAHRRAQPAAPSRLVGHREGCRGAGKRRCAADGDEPC